MISTPVLIAIVVLVLVVIAAVVLLAVRARRPAADRSALPETPPPGGFACPFCKRPYDPAQTGGRCPGCGAAAPRRR